MLCLSLQLFLGCRQWVSIFILYWLVCLLEFFRQLLGYQVWVFEVPLSGCFLCLTGQVFDVIPFVLPMLLLRLLFYILSVPLPWLLLFGLCSGQFSSFSLLLASGWCQKRSIPCVGSPSCPDLLHTYCARVSCCPPIVSRCLSPCLLSVPVVAGICWKG